MSKLLKQLKNNRKIVYDLQPNASRRVWIIEADGTRKIPAPQEYLADLFKISKTYVAHKVYDDFVEIYNHTSYSNLTSTLSLIDTITPSYLHGDQMLVEQWFSVICAEIIASENEKNAVSLKRKIRLAIYQVLILRMPASKAAGFCNGKTDSELESTLTPLGF
jgi:hypothetical protein